MASYPTVNVANVPSSGVDSGSAAIAAGLPAIASLLPGKWGGIIGALAGIPASIQAYDSAKTFTDIENQNRNQAVSAINAYTPYVSRPKEFNADVRVPFAAQAVKIAKAGQEASTRAAEDARIQYGSGKFGTVSPAQLYGAVDNIRRAGEGKTQDSVNSVWEDAQNAWIQNNMAIGNAELQRNSSNEELGMNRLQMLTAALTQPYGVTSPTGISNKLSQDLQFAQKMQLEQDRISAQKWMTYKQVQAQRLSAFTGLGGALGGAGIQASGMQSAANTLAASNKQVNTDTLP